MAQEMSPTESLQSTLEAPGACTRPAFGPAWLALVCATAAGLCAAFVAPEYQPLLQPPLWLASAALAFAHWRLERGDAPIDRRLIVICGQVGLLQIVLYVLAAVLGDLTPRPGRLASLPPSLWLASVQLVGVESVRYCLVSVVGRRRAPLAVALAWLLPWGIQSAAWLAGRPGPYPAHFFPAGHVWLTQASGNLLAAFMALMGGPLASLAYRSILTAFAWLSPATPDLTWVTSAYVAVGSLLIGWLAIVDHIRQARLSQWLEAKVAERTGELSRANARLRELSCRLADLQESERRHIARELHDDTGQSLATLIVGLRLLEREAGDAVAVRHRAAQLIQAAGHAAESLHRLAADLRPASLDRLGLVPALRQHAHDLTRRHGLQVQFEAVGMPECLTPAVEIAIYRIVQEALTNVVCHAQATRADVLLQCREGRLVAVVEDDGVGFDPQRISSARLGLLGMQERSEMLGGTLTVESAPGAGTTVAAEVPCGGAHSDR